MHMFVILTHMLVNLGRTPWVKTTKTSCGRLFLPISFKSWYAYVCHAVTYVCHKVAYVCHLSFMHICLSYCGGEGGRVEAGEEVTERAVEAGAE